MKKCNVVCAFAGFIALLLPGSTNAQTQTKELIPAETATQNTTAPTSNFFKDRKLYLNDTGTNYVKFTFMTQAWVRSADYNPGTTINGYAKNSGTDISIRRYRIQMYGQLTDRVFAYSQFGENNFNNIADRKLGFFVHDAFGEYAIDLRALSLGAGLSGYNGLTRYASSAVGGIMGLDLPLYQEPTNDVTDQFGRKLSVYAKGKLRKLDYRISMAQPMAIQKSASYNATVGQNSSFSQKPPKMQYNAYVAYQFLDEELNMVPYATGSYYGKKTVFNIGAGLMYQKDAMWHLNNTATDTINSNMLHFAGDIYYDAPIGSKGQSISLYGAYTHYDFGKNYIRNTAPVNPSNGSNNGTILNGSGIGYPAFGTGNTFYIQAGYKFKENLIGKTTLMPYVSVQHANYDRLNDSMNYYDAGVNWLLAGNVSKFTVAYQNRPVFNTSGDRITTKSAIVAQYQVLFN